MNAKEELIAAALTAAGSIRWQYPELSDDLRELCARAMAQPEMAEVERLVSELIDAAEDNITRADQAVEDEARAALLDYVRAIVAERDALKHDVERLVQIVSQEVRAAPQPVGEVPMPTDDNLLCYQQGYAAGVEVMACDEDEVRAYGDAREAAGYARGAAAAAPYLGTIDDALRNFEADTRGEVKP